MVLGIIVLILMVVCFAKAEQNAKMFDFSSFSDDELLALREQLNNEIVGRKLAKKAIVPPGVYLVGTDIPEGRYIVTGEIASIRVYESEEKVDNEYKEFYYFEGIKKSESIVLASGEVIVINHEGVEFEVYTGFVFE